VSGRSRWHGRDCVCDSVDRGTFCRAATPLRASIEGARV